MNAFDKELGENYVRQMLQSKVSPITKREKEKERKKNVLGSCWFPHHRDMSNNRATIQCLEVHFILSYVSTKNCLVSTNILDLKILGPQRF